MASENDKRKAGAGNFVCGILELFQVLACPRPWRRAVRISLNGRIHYDCCIVEKFFLPASLRARFSFNYTA